MSKASAEGFASATSDLTVNLQRELDLFKVRAKEEPESVTIEHKPGYTGGGALGGSFALGLGQLLVARIAACRVRRYGNGDSSRQVREWCLR
ncbi:MAG: hypothetical protein J6386_09115 [Candidatus Synoicihabitans palmerolidicus]|nr:hypothetical protein [Candidatus Synoicihabitans palmerolidicus]